MDLFCHLPSTKFPKPKKVLRYLCTPNSKSPNFSGNILTSSTQSTPRSKFATSEKSRRRCSFWKHILPLAPSPKLIELLARRARQATNPIMSLVVSPQGVGYPPAVEKKPLEEAPPVVITPSDPWPRPYIFDNGLRRVAPYHFTYNTWCKERWRGRELQDIFAEEFRDRPVEYYVGYTGAKSIYILLI